MSLVARRFLQGRNPRLQMPVCKDHTQVVYAVYWGGGGGGKVPVHVILDRIVY